MAVWYFLAYFSFTSCLVAGQSTIYVLKGLEINFKPGVTGHPEYILWTHKGYKVVEFNGQEEHVYDPFTNRITLNWITAELSITYLGFDDNGDYELEAYVDSTLHKAEFNLEVIEEVAKPSISCEMTEGSSSNLSATLVCAAEPRQPQSLIKFEWSSHGNTQPGSKLAIPLGEENDDEVYTCTVSNPLSMETATFTAKDCYPDKPSSKTLIISIVTLALTLLLVVLGIMCCKRRHKACFAKAERDDLEKGSKSGPTEGSAEEKGSLLNTSSTLPSNQPLHQELKEETEEVSNTESPTNGISPADQPPSSLTQTSSIMASGDTTSEHKEDTNSDQVNGDSERGCREADSSDQEKTNKSDGSRENEQSSTTPGQKVSDTTQQQQDSKSSEEEPQTNEDDKQQIDKPVSAVENGSQSEGDSEEKDNQLKQDGATPSEPGNMNTSNIQESTWDGANKEEGKEKKDSEESGDGQDEKHKDKHEKAASEQIKSTEPHTNTTRQHEQQSQSKGSRCSLC